MARVVRCQTEGCEHRGVVRNVQDLRVAEAIYTRPPLFCGGCGSELAEVTAQPEHINPGPVERAVRRPPSTRRK